MNAQQRRTQRRTVSRSPAALGCHTQGYSGAKCNPVEHAEWLREQQELDEE